MQCVILAAGEGSRMRPLTTSRPKVMLPLAGKPMLEHLIQNVRDAGITDIYLVVGYHEEAIRTWFDDGSKFGVSIHYVVHISNSRLLGEMFIGHQISQKVWRWR